MFITGFAIGFFTALLLLYFKGENGLTPKQTVIEKLTDHYNIRYNKNDARNFFGLGDESEYQKRIDANMEKARKIIEKEDQENNE